MDLQLLDQLHDRNIAGTYMESKFFLNPGNAKVINRKDLAEITFVSLMGMFVLYQLPHTRKDISDYATKTIKWDMSGTYARHRIQASDLYIALQAMHDYEHSQIAGQLMQSNDINKLQVSIERIDKTKVPVKRFLLDVAYMQLPADENRFFFNLQTYFYITDPKLAALRRNVGSWSTLSKSEKTYTLTRLSLWLKRHAPKFDLNSVFTRALAARDIDIK